MPWKRTDPMEERMRLVMEVESEVFQMSELCERYGVSRKTGYKWLERYRKEGVAGLQDRSRAPLHCPHRTAEVNLEELIEARRPPRPRRSSSKPNSLNRSDDDGGGGKVLPLRSCNWERWLPTRYLRPTSRESFGPGIDATVFR